MHEDRIHNAPVSKKPIRKLPKDRSQMEKDMVAIDGTNQNEIKRSKPEEKLISQIIRGQLYYVYEKV